MNVNYGIMIMDVSNLGILGFIGFETEPTVDDYKRVYLKVSIEEEYKLCDRMKDIFLCPAGLDHLDFMKRCIEDGEFEEFQIENNLHKVVCGDCKS